ncbi:MAG: XRE family transcriptional regulator [Oscillibacter sp.]|uniref:helix-turn-helix domain-containing protein n=1 Tax=Oscillibacter sp. TaxID=1945593 RepID=UPI00132422C1|nr:helix-turn-helix transcriptional regulator [Oscillibacter sp.]MUU10886.1 XRE family transcriptional regulator [Oscillibacter sp.]
MKLRECREAAGLSKADVARIMQVDQSAVARWEAGAALPRASKLPKLADLFGCTIDALYGRTRPPTVSATSTQKGGHP